MLSNLQCDWLFFKLVKSVGRARHEGGRWWLAAVRVEDASPDRDALLAMWPDMTPRAVAAVIGSGGQSAP
jgi:hypothetical protein